MAAHRAQPLVVMNMLVRPRSVLSRRRIKEVSTMGSSLEGLDKGGMVRVRRSDVETARWLGCRVGDLPKW